MGAVIHDYGRGTPVWLECQVTTAFASVAVLAVPVNAAFSTASTGGSLAQSTTYYYRVTATNASGETLPSTETSQVVGASGTATNTVTVNWGAVTGATGYKVYGRTTGAEQLIGTITSGFTTTFVDTGAVTPAGAMPVALATPVNAAFATSTTGGTLAAGTYYYRVSALSAQGETLASTETSQATTGSTSTVTVNWGSVAGAVGYRVYGRSTGAELLLAQVGAVLTFVDTGAITPAGILPVANTSASAGATLQAQLIMADDAALSVNVVTLQESMPINKALLVPGYTFRLGGVLPPGVTSRFLGFNYIVSPGPFTAGNILGALVFDRQTNPIV
jgi:hypothetical protein